MSRAALSVFVAGLYAGALSLTFFTVPDIALNLFGLPAHKDVFVFVAAMLLLFVAGYFIVSARNEVRGFFRLTVFTRLSVALFLGAFVALGQARVNLLLFAPPDIVMALWTLLALRADSKFTAKKAAVLSVAGASSTR